MRKTSKQVFFVYCCVACQCVRQSLWKLVKISCGWQAQFCSIKFWWRWIVLWNWIEYISWDKHPFASPAWPCFTNASDHTNSSHLNAAHIVLFVHFLQGISLLSGLCRWAGSLAHLPVVDYVSTLQQGRVGAGSAEEPPHITAGKHSSHACKCTHCMRVLASIQVSAKHDWGG